VGPGEVSHLLERAEQAARRLRAQLDARPVMQTELATRLRRELPAVLERLDRAGRETHDLGAALDDVGPLAGRRLAAGTRADKASDPVAGRTYRALAAQLTDDEATLARVRAAHERRVARLHADVARLERLDLALLHLRAARDPSDNADGSTEALRLELDATAEALLELDA